MTEKERAALYSWSMKGANPNVMKTLVLMSLLCSCGKPLPSSDSSCSVPHAVTPKGPSLGLISGAHEDLTILEGDIVVASRAGRAPRGVVAAPASWTWNNGIIPFEIDSGVSDPARVQNAVAHWNSRLQGVIRLVPHNGESDYVRFVPFVGGCMSSLGRVGGEQQIFLDPHCATNAIIHEIGHTVGLYHEQSRNDRDQYIIIHWENISAAYQDQFMAAGSWGQDIGAYDFSSIMHYYDHAFSFNGLPTIESRIPGQKFGNAQGLSVGDVTGVMIRYGVNPKVAAASASNSACR